MVYQDTFGITSVQQPPTEIAVSVNQLPLAGGLTPFQVQIFNRGYADMQLVVERGGGAQPGDLYIWDNFRVLHGRERVLGLPRTSVGQTVPEQVVADRYRVLKMAKLKDFIDERWLVHTPLQQLHEMVRLVGFAEPEY